MNLPAISRSSCLAFLACMALAELRAQQVVTPAAFRTSAQMVLVPVTVTDHYGKTVTGLGARDFMVFDDQTPQPIMSFTSEDAPCSVGIVLDTSGSMRYTLGAAKDIAHAFFATSNPEDEFLLLTVSTEPAAVSGFTTHTDALEDTLQLTRPAGMTALIDTVYLGLNRMRAAKQPRRALLIISDGLENNSRYSKSELMRVALEADVQIYALIVDGLHSTSSSTVPFRPSMVRKPGDQGQERQGPSMLEELSDKTGGLHFRVHSAADARESVVKVGLALRNQYVIAYSAPGSGPTGKWHRIRVKTNVPKVTVFARSGYYSR